MIFLKKDLDKFKNNRNNKCVKLKQKDKNLNFKQPKYQNNFIKNFKNLKSNTQIQKNKKIN